MKKKGNLWTLLSSYKVIVKMKHTFLILLLLIGFVEKGTAQKNLNQEEMIGFACFFGGMPTDPVLKVIQKVFDKKYTAIAEMLQSKNTAERYMAVISLERLDTLNKYTLSESDKLHIKKIKQSSELVSVCAGCSYFDTVELKKMFTTEMEIGARNWLDKYF